MEKQDPAVLLKELIRVKQAEHTIEGKMLKEHFKLTFDSLRPINIIKSTFKEMVSSPELKESLLNKAIGFVSGVIVKKVFLGSTHNPITKLLGTVVELAVANKVSKNADGIKSIGTLLLNKLFNKQPTA